MAGDAGALADDGQTCVKISRFPSEPHRRAISEACFDAGRERGASLADPSRNRS